MPRFVKWVPTPDALIDAFFELAPVSGSDVVYDLGSGDGRLLFSAIERGAGRCVGIELDDHCLDLARQTAALKGVEHRVALVKGDVIAHDLSSASVILCYLLPSATAALRPKFESELRAGTRLVMEMFAVPGWKPVKTLEISGRSYFLYVMPPERTADYETSVLEDTAYEDDWFYWP